MVKSYLLGNIAENIRDHSLFIYMESGLGKKATGLWNFFFLSQNNLEKYYFNVYEFLDQQGMHSCLIWIHSKSL